MDGGMTSCGALDTIGDALFVPQMSRATADAMDGGTTSRHAFDTIGGVSLVPKSLAQPRHNFPFRRRTHWKPSWWHDRKFGLLWYDCPCWRSAPDVRSDLESNGATVYSDQTMEPRSPRDSEGSVTSESRKRPPCYGSTIDRLRCLRRRTWDLGIEDKE